jgi:hypothetical protein
MLNALRSVNHNLNHWFDWMDEASAAVWAGVATFAGAGILLLFYVVICTYLSVVEVVR